jgi:putative ABC transport system ATP-binding protein
MTPTCGEVWLSGRNISSLTGAARDKVRKEHIGLVFQTLRLISALSVRDNLLLAQHIASGRSDEGAADDLIARVGLSHRANARPRQLSQGESQRAAIARALCVRPSLVVADEPTSALDDNNAQAMMDLLFSAAEANGATLLIATHDHRIRDRFSNTISLNMQRAA